MEKFPKFLKTASSGLQYEINTSIIFNYIRENGPITRIKISNDLKISPSAVSRAIDKLIKEGYIIEGGKVKTKGGKRPTLIKVKPDRGYVIGIDMAKEKIKFVLANFNGEVVDIFRGFKITDDKDIALKVVKEIDKIMAKHRKYYGIEKNELKAICIGIPADIDSESGKIINAPLYRNWKDINFRQVIEKEFNIPVYIENDVNLSAIGENHYGEGKNFKDLIFVEISNGIGAGIITNNHLFRGSFGSAGEIGFTIINTRNLGFKLKNKGFLEEFASVHSIKQKAVKEVKNGKKTMIAEIANNDIGKIESRTVFEAAMQGDKTANSIIKGMADILSIGIINLILILNPQCIVIGGDICNLPDVDKLILEPIDKKVKNSIPFEIPKIELSSLGEDAGILGASYNAIDSLLMDTFPYKIEEGIVSLK
jgi:N-acetylglucosamine repressor